MNFKKTGILLAGVIMLGITASGCAMLKETGIWQKPRAEISSVKLSDLSFEEAGMDVCLNVSNPNPYNLNLGMLDYTLTIEGSRILEGSQEKNTALAANQSQEIIFPVRVAFEDLFAAVSGLRQKNVVNYSLDGGVKFNVPMAGMHRIPFSRQGELPVPKMPKIRVKDLRLDNLNMLGATLKLKLAMENPNAFGINLNRFDYFFKLNNNPVADGQTASTLAAGPGETGTIELPLHLSFANTGFALYKILKNEGNLDYQLAIDGEAGSTHDLLNKFPFHTERSGTVQLK